MYIWVVMLAEADVAGIKTCRFQAVLDDKYTGPLKIGKNRQITVSWCRKRNIGITVFVWAVMMECIKIMEDEKIDCNWNSRLLNTKWESQSAVPISCSLSDSVYIFTMSFGRYRIAPIGSLVNAHMIYISNQIFFYLCILTNTTWLDRNQLWVFAWHVTDFARTGHICEILYVTDMCGSHIYMWNTICYGYVRLWN